MAQHRSGGARDLVITCIKGEGKLLKFWALPLAGLETVKNFESHFSSLQTALDSSIGFSRSELIPVNSRCVVKSKIKLNKWCRAFVLAHQGYNAVLVQLLDYGNQEAVSVADVRRIEDPIMTVPAQAIECILADVMPLHNEWSNEAIDFCDRHLLYNTLSCFIVSDYVVSELIKIPIVRIAKKGETEAFVQRLINGGLALIKRESPSPPPATLSYKMNTMDPNTSHLVRVSCIENAQKFYVQLSAAEMELKHLMDTINAVPKESFVPLKVAAVNAPCLAQLSSKPCYYRALITGMQHTRCKVFFVDYGFSELKDVQELRAIHPTFLQLPAQAICCSSPRDASIDCEEFKRLVGYEHLELHVQSRTTESYIVKLFYRGHDLLLSPPIPQTYIQQKLNLGANCDVSVTYVNDVTEFYCQLSQLKEQQSIISNILNTGYNFTPISLNECVPGKPVCVKFSEDNLWYRARIMKVSSERDIEVFFVDFGNYDKVSISDVRKIGSDLLKFPIQAFKCFLFETPIPTEQEARDEAFDMLEELTADQSLFAYVNSFSNELGYGVTLYLKNSSNESVNQKLLAKFLNIPTVPVEGVENVYVTSFTSPNSFYVQFEKLDSEKLAAMQEEINSFYSGVQNISFSPKEGNLVCARFNEDDQFYRAKVEQCRSGFCDVFFLDYGNRESISVKDVHMIDSKFVKYPQFGTECAFEKKLPEELTDKLCEVMLENSIQVNMLRKTNDKWYVSLVENFAGNAPVLNVMRQLEAPVPRSIHGAGLGGFQEKASNFGSNYSDSRNSDSSKASHFVNKSEPFVNNENTQMASFKRSETTEFEDYSLIAIPPKAFRHVYVSHVISPGEFYCQIEEDSPKLQLLMKTIEDSYSAGSDNFNLLNFAVDSPCCAMFEDGIWYRGKIKKVDQNSCDVFFVDYGNTDSVSKSKIKKLRNDLIRCPCQALCCKSYNISPKSKEWNDDEINAFMDMALEKSFFAQFVECDSSNCYAVNLFSIGKLEDNIFDKEFVALGYGRLQDTSKSFVLNSHAASASLSFSFPDIKEGASEAVLVSYGLNPGEIFCQLKSCEQDFKNMMLDMQNYYNKANEAECLIDRPHQGMICVAQFFLDSAWYRAEIKKVETNKIIVFYVDYGNSEIVDRKKVRCIVQEYTSLPVQAVKCRIRGIKPPGKSWTVNKNLGKYFEGDAFCKFISKEKDSFVVDITCNRKDVAQLLISDGVALSDGLVHKEESPVKTRVDPPKFAQIEAKSTELAPSLILPKRTDNFVSGQLLSVTVSFIESPLKFWCQSLDECDILNELIADIETKIIECSPADLNSIKKGSYCMAQYSEDEAWYRAQITSCEPGNKYGVFFIDYGNSEVVSLSQMKQMLPEFSEIPPQCFECSLQNTPSKLLPEMATLFRDTLEEVEESTMKIESIRSGICIVTLLFEKDDQEINLNELLFGAKGETFVSDDTSSASPQFLPPDVPLGLHEGYVSVVNSPQDFYIQLTSSEDILNDMSNELDDIAESSTAVNPDDLCIGYPCYAKYSEDDVWYRAEVTSMQDSSVSVLFVDYGNVDTVEKDTLKRITEKHLEVPVLAIKCKLNGIVPPAEEWTKEAVSTFQDMVVIDSSLGITFISKDIPATVNITKEDKEIAQCLVEMELANVESCTETDEAYAEDHLAPAPIEDPISSLPYDQSYPKRKLSSSKHAVKICYVDSFDKFFVTPLELSTELDTVMTTLELLYASDNDTGVLEDPKASLPCVAKYSEDGAWYRALITEIEGEHMYVTFIDYGNSEITNIDNLRPITPELLKIPPIAVECSLFGISAIPDKEQEITKKLEEYFVEEMELEMEICEFSPYKIKLSNNGDDIASMFVREGLAKEQLIPVEAGSFVDSSKMTFVDESLEYKIQITKRFFSGADKIVGNVKFCEIENDLIVFHVVSTDLEDDLQDLQQKLQDAYHEPSQNLANVACMDFCATKYVEDENWYRAQVLSFDKDKVKVRFIDYGNCETVDMSDIYELLGDFTIEPQFSVKCILFGLKVDKSKEVELQNKLDEHVYHEPVELKLCKHSHAAYDLCITSIVCGDIDITEIISSEKLVFQQYIINSQLDTTFKATVQKILEDTIFLLPSSAVDERENFQCKLQNVCKDLETLSDIQINYLCAAKVNNIWYRVSVINVSDQEVTVDLIDFGLTKVANISDLVPLPLDVCHQPIFLQPCIINNLGKSAGNAKKISLDDLSIGCEILCEFQKTYPVVHPVPVQVLEIPSKQGDNETENQNKVVCEELDNARLKNEISEDLVQEDETVTLDSQGVTGELEENVNTNEKSENDIADHDNQAVEDELQEEIVSKSENEVTDHDNQVVRDELEEVENSSNVTENFETSKEEKTVGHDNPIEVDEEKDIEDYNDENELAKNCTEGNTVMDEENVYCETVDHDNEIASGDLEEERNIENYSDENEFTENYAEENEVMDLEDAYCKPKEKDNMESCSNVIKNAENYIEEEQTVKYDTQISSADLNKERNIEKYSDENEFAENYTEENKVMNLEDVYCEPKEKDNMDSCSNVIKNAENCMEEEQTANYDNQISSGDLDENSNAENSNNENAEHLKGENNTVVGQNINDIGEDLNSLDNFEKSEDVSEESKVCEEAFDIMDKDVASKKEDLDDELNGQNEEFFETDDNMMKDDLAFKENNSINLKEVHPSEANLSLGENVGKVAQTDLSFCEENSQFKMCGAPEDKEFNDDRSNILVENVTGVNNNFDEESNTNEVDECGEHFYESEQGEQLCDASTLPPQETNEDKSTKNAPMSSDLKAGFESNNTTEDSHLHSNMSNLDSSSHGQNLGGISQLDMDSNKVEDEEVSAVDQIDESENENAKCTKYDESEKKLSNIDCPETNDDFNLESDINCSEDTSKGNNRGIEDSYQLSGTVQVKVSHVAISDGSVIFAVQPLYLEEEFLLLKQSIQDFYSAKAVPYDSNSDSNYCVVCHENEWCRGKILQSGDSTVLLIDYGKCTSVDSSNIKNLDSEHSTVPPFAVWCTLSSVICAPEKSETATTFLCDKVKNAKTVIKILEGGEPYQINLFVDGESIINHLLKNRLVSQKLPNLYLEPGPYNAKLSFLNINLNTVEIYVNLMAFCDDYNALFEVMQKTYKVEDCVNNVVESVIYAVLHNDSWYRGLVVSSGKETQVYLVDVGETITSCKNLCFLLPEHCLQPSYAILCHIPFSDIHATNDILEAISSVLKTEFLVDIKLCPDSNTIRATLIDEQIVSEVKNIGLTYSANDLEPVVASKTDSASPEISCTNDAKLPDADSFPEVKSVEEPMTSDQIVGYLEETFTTE